MPSRYFFCEISIFTILTPYPNVDASSAPLTHERSDRPVKQGNPSSVNPASDRTERRRTRSRSPGPRRRSPRASGAKASLRFCVR